MTFSQDFLKNLVSLLLSEDFLEKAIFLLLTAGLSGFLVPYILRLIDARKLRFKMEFEADLARAKNILDAQISLLENLSKSLWELQLLALAVYYYKVHLNPEKYKVALEDYDKKSWKLFRNVRFEISKAARLVSNDLYTQLLNFFKDILIDRIDETLIALIQKEEDTSLEKWKKEYYYLLYTLPDEIDQSVITPLAEELRLSSTHKTITKHSRKISDNRLKG